MAEVPRRTLLAPLASPYFVLCLSGVVKERLLFDYQVRAGDHFHCAVEPLPGHVRCRGLGLQRCKHQLLGALLVLWGRPCACHPSARDEAGTSFVKIQRLNMNNQYMQEI